MGMEFASNFDGTLVVKFKLFELVKGVFNITGFTNTQKDSMKSHSLVSSQYLDFDQVHVPLVCIQLVGCLTRLAVVVLCVVLCVGRLLRNAWYEQEEEGEEEEEEKEEEEVGLA
eukprot:1151938-Pelagomonas_calceolata.AAC.2